MVNKLYLLYTITNNITGYVYVGKTSNAKRFWKDHIKKAFVHNDDTWLYRDMRKYGLGSFQLDILKEGLERDYCAEEQVKCIGSYRAIGKCYNMTAGGFGGDTYVGKRNGRDAKPIEGLELPSVDLDMEITGSQDERVKKVFGSDGTSLNFGSLFGKK
jgi:hypothetical protein